MDGFCVKGESYLNDFYYTNLVNIDSFNSEELCDRQYEMFEKGSSYPINTKESRDGVFCEEDIFLVFEKEDLIEIRNYINTFLGEYELSI